MARRQCLSRCLLAVSAPVDLMYSKFASKPAFRLDQDYAKRLIAIRNQYSNLLVEKD